MLTKAAKFLIIATMVSFFVGPAHAFHKGIVHGGGGGGADVTLDWNNLINVPDYIADGDDDNQLTDTEVLNIVGPHTTDTQLDATGITNLGFVAGAHTTDTDTQLNQADIETFGFVTGPHTGGTAPTQGDIQALGFVIGGHTTDTDTQLDQAGIEALVGEHTANAATECFLGEVFVADGAGGGLCFPQKYRWDDRFVADSAWPCDFRGTTLGPSFTWYDDDSVECRLLDRVPGPGEGEVVGTYDIVS